MEGWGLYSGNVLKLIAAVSMLIDHIGVIFFPDVDMFRIAGRISYPIFSYMISEGCRYTANRKKYLIKLILVSMVCQGGYYIYERSIDMCIMVTFAIAVAVAFCVQRAQSAQIGYEKVLRYTELAGAVAGVWVVNMYFDIDYGFWGCIIPVLPLLLTESRLYTKLVIFGIGLAVLASEYGGVQWYSLLALPLLALYNGKRGKYRLKHFFYIFYPLHLAVLELIKNVT